MQEEYSWTSEELTDSGPKPEPRLDHKDTHTPPRSDTNRHTHKYIHTMLGECNADGVCVCVRVCVCVCVIVNTLRTQRNQSLKTKDTPS